jgi:hypothetical protein
VNRARVAVEQLAEVRLAQPSVDAMADLDAQGLGNQRRTTEPPREIHLSEAALAEQSLDLVLQLRFGTGDDLTDV